MLAVVQGLTEFLPISSTAHLVLVPWFFGWRDPGLTFDVALHVGTLIAVLAYFSRTWTELTISGLGLRRPPDSIDAIASHLSNKKLFWLLVLSTIPAGAAGWLLQKQVETTLRNPVVMGTALILIALLMAWGEKVGTANKDITRVGLADSLWIGFSQALALIPGVSRSGITMTAALIRNFQRVDAARYSLLLSTPIIFGASLKTALDAAQGGIQQEMIFPMVVGIIVAAVVGYLTISFFLKYLQFGTFKIFVYYRIILGIMVLALALFVRLEITP